MTGPFSYVIVGAGSAGCVLANRLSENPAHRVLLLEAGPTDTSPLIAMPKGFGRLLLDPTHAAYTPVAPHAGNAHRAEVWARGKMLGGSSAINGMVYMRGHSDDYNDWVAQGATGWGWADIAPGFKAIEDHALGADALRGAGAAPLPADATSTGGAAARTGGVPAGVAPAGRRCVRLRASASTVQPSATAVRQAR